MRLLACLIAAAVYVWREQIEFSFSQLQFAVFILVLSILSLRLCLFLRGPTRIQPPKLIAGALGFIGRHTLEIYAIELIGFRTHRKGDGPRPLTRVPFSKSWYI